MITNEHGGENVGCIIVGYQGIGKSSVVNKQDGFIDLESSCFKREDGSRHDDWYKDYVDIAIDLSNQGYFVFVSSHKQVREQLFYMKKKHNLDLLVLEIFPDSTLKYEWIERLRKRWKQNDTNKNFIAYQNAKDSFDKNIFDFLEDKKKYEVEQIILKNVNYDLFDEITKKLELE